MTAHRSSALAAAIRLIAHSAALDLAQGATASGCAFGTLW